MTELPRLVEDAKAGSELAFAELVRRYRDWAISRAVAILGDYELAQDVVQEAFATAHASLSTLTEPAAFPSWVRTIVRRCCYRALRKQQPDLASLEAASEIPGNVAEPDRLAAEEERRHEAPYGIGSVQTAFLPIRDMAAPPAGFFDPLDATITLSLALAKLGMFPAIDPVASVSKNLEPATVGAEHVSVAARVRDFLRRFPAETEDALAAQPMSEADRPPMERARRLRRFLTQPFYFARPWIRWPAALVPVDETVRACAAILDGVHDTVPESASYMANGIEEVMSRAANHTP